MFALGIMWALNIFIFINKFIRLYGTDKQIMGNNIFSEIFLNIFIKGDNFE